MSRATGPVDGPTFLGIGAQRAGTTWVHSCLGEHPQVHVPEGKELHYFSWRYEKGKRWYLEQLAGGEQAMAVGEVTPNYLNVPHAVPRIAKDFPSVRIFVVLREPAERAYSAYRLMREEKFRGLGFAEALERDPSLLELGLYSRQIERVLEHFPPEQVLIELYDNLQRDPVEFLTGLFRFIGVDEAFRPPSLRERYNQALYPGVQAALDNLGLGGALERFKSSAAGAWFKRVHANTSRPGGEECPALGEYFREDIERLQTLTRLDLQPWLMRAG